MRRKKNVNQKREIRLTIRKDCGILPAEEEQAMQTESGCSQHDPRGAVRCAHRRLFVDHHSRRRSLYVADIRRVHGLRAAGRKVGAVRRGACTCCWARRACRYFPALARAWGRSLGPTGGYILGFAFTALSMWGVEAKFGQALPARVAGMALGLAALLRLWHGVVHGCLRAHERPHRPGRGAFHVRGALPAAGLRQDRSGAVRFRAPQAPACQKVDGAGKGQSPSSTRPAGCRTSPAFSASSRPSS